MAVEAPHTSLNFPSHLLTNRDFVKVNQANMSLYNTQMDSGLVFNEPMPETLLSFYQSSLGCDPVSAKASNKDDSGLTYNVPAVVAPRKRPRDSINDNFDAFHASQKTKVSPLPSFIDQEIIFQIQQQQSETDRLIAEHNQKVRMELEDRRKRQSRMLVSAIQEGMVKKLKEKDEEIQRMGKLNWVLQEKVKSLYLETQIWRDLAQANEATANSLRSNLEQVLAHVSEDRYVNGGRATVEDDAESSCGSSDYGRSPLAGGEEGAVKDKSVVVKDNSSSKNINHNRMCKKCGERESSVLLLPCRHLCLCTLCGSNLIGTCPVCDSAMDGSVHVNMA
ncbi:SBP (S-RIBONUCLEASE BINDING PROTEIN) FAMILY PROTEIN [Salix viminalis]|uniref:SBP (S-RIBONUCLEASE BINDING PROTEIN) FAMILY PROTEIN n=1 Tax=Salix viminalis TaxID=40686 RepID=A0A9Q0NLA8_SALVM|nr:SBP (S-RIBONUCLEASE BINDING PROTEIN) FAMILY PROTEIN [Salix viminalis]